MTTVAIATSKDMQRMEPSTDEQDIVKLIIGDGNLDHDVIGMCACSASDDNPY